MSESGWKNVEIVNHRGQKLAGVLYATGRAAAPVLVVCHGFTGSKEGGGKALEMGEYLAETGYDVLLFDFAGSGGSEGDFEDTTLTGQIGDLASVVGWCERSGAGPVVTMGRSFGGTTAIAQTAGDERVRAVCSWAAPADPFKLFQGVVRPDTAESERVALVGEGGDEVWIKRDFLRDLRTYDIPALAARISPRPLFVIHGDDDETVPAQEARNIFLAAEEPKELKFIRGGDHRFTETHRQVWDQCRQWLRGLEL
jgi:putative redox protein